MNISSYRFEGEVTAGLEKVLRRSEIDISDIFDVVDDVIAHIKADGDKALLDYTAKFDKVDLAGKGFLVSKEEQDAAIATLDDDIKAVIDTCAVNIRKFHEAQMPESLWFEEIEPGVLAGEKATPIDSLALYVPRGKGAFPSVMLMLGIPAAVAGVPKVVICTPPTPDGGIDAATAYAARVCGHDEIYRMGGAQAIAALALGTETIPKVLKVLGPGNSYVTAAKRRLSNVFDVGIPAGPSESIIMCDENANPEIVARDLMIEAEHGPDSSAVLVTHSQEIADKVKALLPGLVSALPAPRDAFCTSVFENYGGIVVTDSLDRSCDFVNLYAPEHLEILVADPMDALGKIRNAGEILLGENSVITIGNFCLGVNAILPTGGNAKTAGCLTVHDFMKRSSIGLINKEGFASLGPVAKKLADYEGFPAHANALSYRLGKAE
ncbi:MAG: histidinol dehydrogenase [Methyloligellaceae bacterium]